MTSPQGQKPGPPSRRSNPARKRPTGRKRSVKKPQAAHGLEETVKKDAGPKTLREYILWGVGSVAAIVLLALVGNLSGMSGLPSRPDPDEEIISTTKAALKPLEVVRDVRKEIISTTKVALESTDVDVRDVKIVDGRAKRSGRAMVITYAHSFDQSERMAEVVKVLESGYASNEHSKAEIDSVVAVVSDTAGRTKAIIGVKVADVRWFMETKDSPGYLKRWTVALFDRRFLPKVAREMGW